MLDIFKRMVLVFLVLVFISPLCFCSAPGQQEKEVSLKEMTAAAQKQVKALAGTNVIKEVDVVTMQGFKVFIVEWQDKDKDFEVFVDAAGVLLRKCVEPNAMEAEDVEDEEGEENEAALAAEEAEDDDDEAEEAEEAEVNEAEEGEENEAAEYAEVQEDVEIYVQQISRDKLPAAILKAVSDKISDTDKVDCEYYWDDEELLFEIEITRADKAELTYLVSAKNLKVNEQVAEEIEFSALPAQVVSTISKSGLGEKFDEVEKVLLAGKVYYDVELVQKGKSVVLRFTEKGKLLARFLEESDSEDDEK